MIDRVDLRKGDDFRLVRKTAAIGFEFAAHGFIGLSRMFGSGIDQMEKHAAAFDMAQKPVAKPMALMRPFDQARNIGNNEFAAIARRDPKLRMEGGERIIRDLGLCVADSRQKRRFPGIGQADNPGVGDQFQAQQDDALLALLARIGAARGLICRGLEMAIAEAAIAASREADALPGLGQIGKQNLAILVEDLGSGGHFQDRIGALRPGAVLAHAVHASGRLEMLLVAVIDQGVEASDTFGDDIAAAAAVAAVRSAEFNEFLAPERQASGAAVARPDINLGGIEKFHRKILILNRDSWRMIPNSCRLFRLDHAAKQIDRNHQRFQLSDWSSA